MGIGNNRLVRIRNSFRGLDQRTLSRPSAMKAGPAAASARNFFLKLYHTTAETLPHAFDVEVGAGDAAAAGDAINTDLATIREDIMHSILDEFMSNPTKQHLHPETRQRRYLPPGKAADLYDLYLSFCIAVGDHACGHSTFYEACVIIYGWFSTQQCLFGWFENIIPGRYGTTNSDVSLFSGSGQRTLHALFAISLSRRSNMPGVCQTTWKPLTSIWNTCRNSGETEQPIGDCGQERVLIKTFWSSFKTVWIGQNLHCRDGHVRRKQLINFIVPFWSSQRASSMAGGQPYS